VTAVLADAWPMTGYATALRRMAAIAPTRVRSRLDAYAALLERVPESRRPVVAAAIARVTPALRSVLGSTYATPLSYATPYPTIPEELAARLILGERPLDLADGHLTRHEAHAWLAAGAPSLGSWILREAAIHVNADLDFDVRVALWLRDRWARADQREALTRPRRQLMAGQLIEGSYLDHVDAIRAEDLMSSIDDTYRRAAMRAAADLEHALASHGEPLAPEPSWWRPVRCARLLHTGPDLVAEGRDMEHCVAMYAGSVRDHSSVIVGLCVLGQRSTVELAPDLSVRQHRGRGNAAPPAINERALDVLVQRWRRDV